MQLDIDDLQEVLLVITQNQVAIMWGLEALINAEKDPYRLEPIARRLHELAVSTTGCHCKIKLKRYKKPEDAE